MAKTIEEISDILNDMQQESDKNVQNINKLLASINHHLEFMESDTESDDLIKVYLSELKKILEEKHAFITGEFSQIQKSLNTLGEEQKKLVKSDQIDNAFAVFSNNLQIIHQQFISQNNIISQLSEEFGAFKNDTSTKNEILTSIETFKKDAEISQAETEKNLFDLNNSVQNVIKNLIVMDPTAQNDIVKRELENIYLTTTSILSAVHENDSKTENLMNISGQFATKENLSTAKNEISNFIIDSSNRINGILESVSQKIDDAAAASNNSQILYEFENVKQLLNSQKEEFINNNNSEKIIAIENIVSELSNNINAIFNEDLQNNNEQITQIIKENFNEVATKIEQLPHKNDFSDLYSSISELAKVLDTIKASLSTTNEYTNGLIQEKLEHFTEIFNSITSRDDFTNFRHDLAEFIQQIINNSNSLNENLNIQRGVLENLINEIQNTQISQNISDLTSIINQIRENAQSNRDVITENIKALENNVISNITENINNDKIQGIHNNIDALRNTFLSTQDSNVQNITGNISSIKDIIAQGLETRDEKLTSLQNNINSNLTSKINSSADLINNNINILKESLMNSSNEETIREKLIAIRDIITSQTDNQNEKITNLQNRIDEFIKAGERISTEAEIKIGNSVSELADLKSELTAISTNFNNWNYNREENDNKIAGFISNEFFELRNLIDNFQNAIQTGILQNLNKYSENIDIKINNLVSNINNLQNDINVSESENTASIQNELIKEIKDKITAVKQELNLVNTDIIDVINSRSEAFMLEIEPIKATLDSILTIKDDIKNIFESKDDNSQQELISAIEEVREAIKNTALNNDEIKNMINVALNNDELKWSIDEFKNNVFAKIDEEKSSISDLLNNINNKIDNLNSSDDGEIDANIEDIKKIISSQEEILKSVNADNTVIIENKLKELVEKLDNISDNAPDLSSFKNEIIEAVVNVFEQISFIEESEEIKDFVEVKTDEINQNIIEVKKQLNQFVNGEDDYSYTLQDVESDIARLRLVLNDLSNTSSKEEISDISDNIHRIVTSVEDLKTSLTQEQVSELKSDFEKLNEDILSISSRTNKLLLTSDESYNALNNGLNDFTNVITELEERINYLDNKEITERIENKLNNTYDIVAESANSDKVMRQVLMYMGEWIDTTSENIQSLCENTDSQNRKSEDIYNVLETIQESLPEQKNILNTITLHFEEQQERLDRVELKLEKIMNAIDNIDDSKLENKIDKIDKQIKKLNTTIEKLATYVD